MNSSRFYLDCLRRFEAPCVSTLSLGDEPLILERGSGARVWDADGREYLDLVGGFGVLSVGHGNPRVVRAIREQSETLLQGMGDVHPPRARAELVEQLVRVTPEGLSKGVVLGSGSEAVEMALKLAARATGRPGVLAFEGGYHGQSYGALAVTHDPLLRAPFLAQLFPGVRFVPFPSGDADPAAALARVEAGLDGPAPGGHPIGAVIVEPIQGRGGNVVPPRGFLAGLREICDRRGALLIADEIMTGFGRTGRWFAVEDEGVAPDLLCVGKGLGGGVSIGAVVGRPEVMDAWRPASESDCYASTFMGHPLACAAALAVLEELAAWKLPERSRDLGEFFLEQLRGVAERHRTIVVRGRGLMIGIECREPAGSPSPSLASRLVREGREAGILLLAGGSSGETLVLWPPLVISHPDIRRFVEFLDAALTRSSR